MEALATVSKFVGLGHCPETEKAETERSVASVSVTCMLSWASASTRPAASAVSAAAPASAAVSADACSFCRKVTART